jgi:hypothetical protein
MNDQQHFTVDPKLFHAWHNLAAAILAPSIETASSAKLAVPMPASQAIVRKPNHEQL